MWRRLRAPVSNSGIFRQKLTSKEAPAHKLMTKHEDSSTADTKFSYKKDAMIVHDRQEIDTLYHLFLGRAPESGSVREENFGKRVLAIADTMVSSIEFREAVLGRFLSHGTLPHDRLSSQNLHEVVSFANESGLAGFELSHFSPAVDFAVDLATHNGAEFVQAAYRIILSRDPDPEGEQHYLAQLSDPAFGKRQIVADLLNSAEFREGERRLRLIWDDHADLMESGAVEGRDSTLRPFGWRSVLHAVFSSDPAATLLKRYHPDTARRFVAALNPLKRGLALKIDTPGAAGGHQEVVLRNRLWIEGWASGEAGIAAVEIAMGDGDPVPACFGLRRDDVAAAYPHWPDGRRSGFAAVLPSKALSAEGPAVRVTARDNSGNQITSEFFVRAEADANTSLPQTLDEEHCVFYRRILARLEAEPIFYITMVMGIEDHGIDWARESIAALLEQPYPDWRLIVIAPDRLRDSAALREWLLAAGGEGKSPSNRLIPEADYLVSLRECLLEDLDGAADRVGVISSRNCPSISEIYRRRLGRAAFFLRLDSGDRLAADALCEFAAAISMHPESEIIASQSLTDGAGLSCISAALLHRVATVLGEPMRLDDPTLFESCRIHAQATFQIEFPLSDSADPNKTKHDGKQGTGQIRLGNPWADWADTGADNFLKLARRLKNAGNPYAALRAYRIAGDRGSSAASVEAHALETMPEASLFALLPKRLGVDEKIASGAALSAQPLTREILMALAWSEQNLSDPARVRAAGRWLEGAGLSTLADAYFDLATLCETFPTGIVTTAQDDGIADLRGAGKAAAPRMTPLPNTRHAILVDLLQQLQAGDCTDEILDDDDVEAFLQQETELFASPPREVNVADFVMTYPPMDPVPIIAEIGRLLSTPIDERESFERLKELARDIMSSSAVASFEADLYARAVGVLFNGIQEFVRGRRQLIAGAFATPMALPPRGGSAGLPAVAALRQDLSHLLETEKNRVGSRPLERAIVLIGYLLPFEDLQACVEVCCERDLICAAGLLLDRMAMERGRRTAAFLNWASLLLKHGGQWRLALKLSREAAALDPSPHLINEAAIQEKTCGNFDRAIRLFESRLVENPDDEFVLSELLMILAEREDIPTIISRFSGNPKAKALATTWLRYRIHLDPDSPRNGAAQFAAAVVTEPLALELAPRLTDANQAMSADRHIDILQLGREYQHTPSGMLRILHDIEAVRVRVVSPTALQGMRLRLNGRTIRWLPARNSPKNNGKDGCFRYTFNAWIDVRSVPPGLYELQIYMEEKSSGYYTQEHLVYIASDQRPASYRHLLPFGDNDLDGTALAARINAEPSVIVPARRTVVGEVKRILVVRADQLGDFVVSIPAISRLCELFPDATLVGLIGRSAVDLARDTGCFADVIPIDFPYDVASRRRILPLGEQIALRKRLHKYSFDLAIDLCNAAHSRLLLRLSGARFTVGFGSQEFPWLSLGIDLHTRGGGDGSDRAPHSTTPLTLVEAVGSLVRAKRVSLPSGMADPKLLAWAGVEAGRYAVLHTGGRHVTQRWPLPSYVDLARLILDSTTLKVVIFVETDADAGYIKQAALPSDRYSLIVGRQEFRVLDTLISHCRVFIGNDSGPKHLAAARGAKVVSIHGGRVPWGEWGQEGDGLIVTRKMPCSGCIAEEAGDCGQRLACLRYITPDEVFTAACQLLEETSLHERAAVE